MLERIISRHCCLVEFLLSHIFRVKTNCEYKAFYWTCKWVAIYVTVTHSDGGAVLKNCGWKFQGQINATLWRHCLTRRQRSTRLLRIQYSKLTHRTLHACARSCPNVWPWFRIIFIHEPQNLNIIQFNNLVTPSVICIEIYIKLRCKIWPSVQLIIPPATPAVF